MASTTPDFAFDSFAGQVDSNTSQEKLLCEDSLCEELIEDCDTSPNTCECSTVYNDLCIQLKKVGQRLSMVLRDSDPLFVQICRELRAVAKNTRELIETMHTTAAMVNSKCPRNH